MKKYYLLLAMVLGITMNVAQAENPTSLVIDVPIAGMLQTVLPLEQANTVTSLKITGFLNDKDITYLSSKTPLLTNLDMSEAGYYNSTVNNFAFQNSGFNSKKSLERVVMPKRITSIGNNAFVECTSLRRIILPDSLRSISYYAFQNCVLLDSVILPPKVSGIDYYAFQNCKALQSIVLPKGLTSLSNNVFQNCSSLKTVQLSDTLTRIYDNTFNNCTSLKQIHLPAKLIYINNYAFSGCSSLDTIALPVTVTNIGYQSFANCSSLKSIVLPYHLTTLNNGAFQNCAALETISFPSNLKVINNEVFMNCVSLKTLDLPDSLETIGNYTFQNCSSLQKLYLPGKLQTIGSYAFQSCSKLDTLFFPPSISSLNSYAFGNCASLKMVVLPGSLTLISEGLFNNCAALDSVYFPVGLTQIGHYAFSGCNSLNGQLILPKYLNYIGYQSFYNCRYATCKSLSTTAPSLNNTSNSLGNIRVAFVPQSSVAPYQSAWSGFLIIGGDTITSVNVTLSTPGTLGEAIMQKASYLKDVHKLTISGPMNIDDLNLIKLNMPSLISLDMKNARLTNIPDYHFSNKLLMLEIVLPDSLESLGYQTFYNCKSIRSFTIPPKVRNIPNNAFQSCSNLGTVFFSEGLKGIGESSFYDCYSLQNVVLPQSLETIGNGAFQYCNQLKSITIPPKVSIINSSVFNNCVNLSEVNLPKGIQRIGSSAFSTCNLTSLNLPDSITLIDDYAFYSNKIRKVILPAQLTELGYNSFGSCSLDSVVLPSGLYNIENSAFSYCTSLKDIFCNQSTPPVLTNDPFYGIDKSKCSLTVPYWSSNMYKTADIWSAFYPLKTYHTEVDQITINGNLVLADNLRFTGTPDVSILSKGNLTVRGNAPLATDHFSTNISFSYSSNWYELTLTDGYGKLINESPSMNANQVSINLNAYGGLWYYMAFPFDVPVDTLAMNNGLQFVFRKYDGSVRAANGTGNSWKTVPGDSLLKAGEGYIYQCSGNGLLKVIPTENTKNQLFASTSRSIPLKEFASASTSNKSWNFVGNPYPAYFDIRYIDFTAPITVWSYRYSTYNALSLIDDRYVLKPYEAFFVQKPEDLSQITFLPFGRQLTGEILNTVQARSTTLRELINLSLSNDNYLDKCRIVINPEASLAYELKFDASKFMSSQTQVPQVYSLDDTGVKYAINERPLESGKIRLGCYFGEDGSYQLSVPDFVNEEENLILTDKLLDKQVSLQGQSYSFTSVKGTFDDRFELTLLKNATLLGTTDDLSTRIWCADGKIHIATKPGNKVSVFTLNGILQKEMMARNEKMEIPLKKGVYIVKVNGTSYKSVVF